MRQTIARQSILIATLCLGVYAGFVAGRYTKECPATVEGKYYKLLPPTAEPATNIISCNSASLHGALEVLRVCRARARSELTK